MSDGKKWEKSQNNYKLDKRFDKKLDINVFYQSILKTITYKRRKLRLFTQ